MKCDLCPRKCLVDRKKGEKGICGQTENLKVARAALHFWEEPCISGDAGSGAVDVYKRQTKMRRREDK